MVPNKNKLITIGITAYKENDYLLEAWDSVLKQTDSNWNAIIVLDGGANKKTKKFFESISHPRLTKYKLEKNLGPYYARSYAIQNTLTDWYCQLDGDDRLPIDFIKTLLNIIENNSNLDYVIGKEMKFTDNEFFVINNYLSFKEQLCFSIPYGQAPIKKQLFVDLGGFCEQLYKGGADWDFWLRVIQSNATGIFVDNIIYEHRRNRSRINVGVQRTLRQYEVAEIIISRNLDYFMKGKKNVKCLAHSYELSAREYKKNGNRKKASELAKLALYFGADKPNIHNIINENKMTYYRYLLRRILRKFYI